MAKPNAHGKSDADRKRRDIDLQRATSKIENESLPGGLGRVRATASYFADVRERSTGGVHGIV